MKYRANSRLTQETLRRGLMRKGLVSNEEALEEVEAVRREVEGKRGR